MRGHLGDAEDGLALEGGDRLGVLLGQVLVVSARRQGDCVVVAGGSTASLCKWLLSAVCLHLSSLPVSAGCLLIGAHCVPAYAS